MRPGTIAVTTPTDTSCGCRKPAADLVTAHSATVDRLSTVLTEEGLGGPAALRPTPLQRALRAEQATAPGGAWRQPRWVLQNMHDSDRHFPPPESAFHGHDAPDRLETETGARREADADQEAPTSERPDRSRWQDGPGPHGAGVKNDSQDEGR
jgi:hypothetical protein